MTQKIRQEVLNVWLAQLLRERGVIAASETIERINMRRHMPDVLVEYQGVRLAIEGEIEAIDARKKAQESAANRVEQGLARIGVSIVYPLSLRNVDFARGAAQLLTVQLEMAITTEAGQSDFVTGNVDDLERLLRSAFDQLIKEDVVAECVALIDAIVEQFAHVILPAGGIVERITACLAGDIIKHNLKALNAKQRAAQCRIGGLIVLNAMIFHDLLSITQGNITPVNQIIKTRNLDAFPTAWRYIVEHVNYYSIFQLASEIYDELTRSAEGIPALIIDMAKTALRISEKRAALRHDLMGRVYHRLLADAKYLGTYYTSIPAATLLLKLALHPQTSVDWGDLDQIKHYKIADLACGTGTLLMAAAETVFDYHISGMVARGKQPDLRALHTQIAQEMLHGYDVLPAAIHLTASTLALRSPDVPVEKMQLFALPLGGKSNSLGTLEFLTGNLTQLPVDFSGAFQHLIPPESASVQRATGRAVQNEYISLPDEIDLCVMNPPFVRSVGGNLLFGSLPSDERDETQMRLKQVIKRTGVKANITAGLGAPFVALADKHVKNHTGRMALILPKTLLSGVAWADTRALINHEYVLDYIIVSHDAERWNFSDSTDLSEVMVVATKCGRNGIAHTRQTTIINLWRNPTNAMEALSIASQLRGTELPDVVSGQGAFTLKLGDHKVGEVVSMRWDDVKDDWFLPCAFAQSELSRMLYHLVNKQQVVHPHTVEPKPIPLCMLSDLGTLGYDVRDITDGYEQSKSFTPYPAFWGHDSQKVTSMRKKPNLYLAPRSAPLPKRPLKNYKQLWQSASNILLAERLRLNTQKLVAIRLDEPALASSWWTFKFADTSSDTTNREKALVLWMNSSLMHLIFLGERSETEGAWVKFKKGKLEAMPVLNVLALTAEQLTTLAAAYDRLCERTLKPLPKMDKDKARAEIDAAIAAALGLPDMAILRKLLSHEPVVSMKRL
jgi:hypothetical protein